MITIPLVDQTQRNNGFPLIQFCSNDEAKHIHIAALAASFSAWKQNLGSELKQQEREQTYYFNKRIPIIVLILK